MQNNIKPVARIADLELEPFSQGVSYQSADAGIAERIGLTQIGANYSEVPPGKSGCPCHVHHVQDEMFIILEGEGTYRFGAGSYQVVAGGAGKFRYIGRDQSSLDYWVGFRLRPFLQKYGLDFVEDQWHCPEPAENTPAS